MTTPIVVVVSFNLMAATPGNPMDPLSRERIMEPFKAVCRWVFEAHTVVDTVCYRTVCEPETERALLKMGGGMADGIRVFSRPFDPSDPFDAHAAKALGVKP